VNFKQAYPISLPQHWLLDGWWVGRVMVFNATFNNISVISWWSVSWGIRSTRRKLQTYRKSLTIFIT